MSITRKNSRWRWMIGTGLPMLYAGAYLILRAGKDQQANRYRSVSLPDHYVYTFPQTHDELTIRTPQAGRLNALLFSVPRAKGVICFWKGNGGTLANWGAIAPTFLQLGYDVLVTDYRQHGKSKGSITLANFYGDAQTVYDSLKHHYRESDIVVCGYSLGGRIAAHLAATNRPRFTVLIDPSSAGGDFSDRFTDMFFYPLPSVNGFTFLTEEDVQQAPRPVVVVSTNNQHSTAYKLKPFLDSADRFVVLPGVTHETILTHLKTERLLEGLLRNGHASGSLPNGLRAKDCAFKP